MSPRHGLAELQEHFKPYEAAAEAAGWEIPERPIIRQVFVAPTMAVAEAKAAPAVDYLYRELYGAASAAGDRVLRRDDGSVIDDPPRSRSRPSRTATSSATRSSRSSAYTTIRRR